jgi:hypothetical protein
MESSSNNKRERFISEILKHSNSNNYYDAINEWIYMSSYECHGSNCICGQDIVEVCCIHNIFNSNSLEIGNVCVRQFIGGCIQEENEINWWILKSFKKNNLFSIKENYLERFFIKGVINDWEFKFYSNVTGKRKLSYKQGISKLVINNKIITHLKENKKKERNEFSYPGESLAATLEDIFSKF